MPLKIEENADLLSINKVGVCNAAQNTNTGYLEYIAKYNSLNQKKTNRLKNIGPNIPKLAKDSPNGDIPKPIFLILPTSNLSSSPRLSAIVIVKRNARIFGDNLSSNRSSILDSVSWLVRSAIVPTRVLSHCTREFLLLLFVILGY